MAFKSQDFIIAAKAVGAPSWYIIVHELLPNVIFVAIVNASMQTAFAITIEASLAYLGLGDPAYLSWGWQLHYAMKAIRRAWWTATFPGFGITLIVVAFNLVGDGLNEALNPYLKER
jgi:peptide/nickel transport system permease protein